MVRFNCTIVHPCATMVHYDIPWYTVFIPWYILALPQYNLLVPWHAMEYHGTSSCHHGTNFLHHGMLWFTIVQPLWKYTATIVHQNLGYHGTIYHAFIIVYFVPFTLWWICITYLMFGTKRFKKTKITHSYQMFWLWYNVSQLLDHSSVLWNYYFRKILTILVANYTARSIIPITLQYWIGRILVHVSLIWITMCYMCATL